MDGSLADRSGLFNFTQPDGRTLFDFQRAAVTHCISRLSIGKTAVLGLDTGLGKTCTVRAVLQEMGVRALVIVPGGLVRQVAAGLTRYPWEKPGDPGNLRVIFAETGKQLQAENKPDHDILVVNRALYCGRVAEEYDVLVIDEAHQASSVRAARFRSSETPVLFVTACPGESPELADFFRTRGARRTQACAKSFSEACFVVEKTPRALTALGVARPRIVLLHSPLHDPEAYDDAVINILESNWFCLSGGSNSRMQAVLSFGALLPRAAAKAARTLQNMVQEARDLQKELPRGDFVGRATALVEAHGLTFPPARATPDPTGVAPDRHNRCGCCGLTASEYGMLHSVHTRVSPTLPPPWTLQKFGFSSALIRFSNKQHIEETLKRHPVPVGVLVFVLTTDKSATYRANLIRRFASHDGQRAKLAVLSRAIKNSMAPPSLLRVGDIGSGRFLLSEIEQYLARPRLLLADSTVDVGFDLHRHINSVYVPQMVGTRAELRQLTGRVSRIAVDQKDQGTIDVLTNCTDHTLDEVLFSKHLEMEEEDEKVAPLLEVAGRIRQKLKGDELALFERLWAQS